MNVNLQLQLDSDIVKSIHNCEYLLTQLVKQGIHIMAQIDDLEASVAKETDVEASAVLLLQQLSQMLKDAIASGNPARIAAVAATIDANTQRLADAVAANTPVATPAVK